MTSKILILLLLFSCAKMPVKETETKPSEKSVPAFQTNAQTKDIKGCAKQVQYFRLLSKLSKQTFKVFNQLSNEELCVEHYSQTKNLLSRHQNKIGIIYTGSDDTKNNAIIEGLKAAQKDHDFLISKVKFKKTPGSIESRELAASN